MRNLAVAQAGQEPGGRSHFRGHKGVLLNGLLPQLAQSAFWQNPWLPAQEWHCSHLGGPFQIKHQSRKCTSDLPTCPDWQIFWKTRCTLSLLFFPCLFPALFSLFFLFQYILPAYSNYPSSHLSHYTPNFKVITSILRLLLTHTTCWISFVDCTCMDSGLTTLHCSIYKWIDLWKGINFPLLADSSCIDPFSIEIPSFKMTPARVKLTNKQK